MYHIFCIHSSRLTSGLFPASGIYMCVCVCVCITGYSYEHMNIVEIVENVSLLHDVGSSSGYMPRNGIAGSSGSNMSNFLRNCQTDFQSGCTSLQSHHQWRNVPLSLHSSHHLLSPEFFILAILTGVR